MGATLKQILVNLLPELGEKMKLREETISSSRRVTVLSKQAIMAVHLGDYSSASSKLEEAREIIQDLEERLIAHPEIRRESTSAAYQEYAEARIFEAVTSGLDFPSPREFSIPTVPYVLGLADVVGEFRRRTLDELNKGEFQEAERSLRRMEEIYNELLPLEYYHSLAPELRRKADIARHLIELTMGDVYTEARRSSLERTLRSLEKKFEATGI